jgi:uncharacterized protein
VIHGVASGRFRTREEKWVKNVGVPTFLHQVRDDRLTDPGAVQTMYDNLSVAEKKLRRIAGFSQYML